MYSAAPFLTTPVSSELYLLQDPLTFKFDIVTQELLSLLQLNNPIPLVRSDRANPRAERPTASPGPVTSLGSPVLATLHDLITHGWLLRHDHLLDELRSGRRNDPEVPIATVAIVTKDRPQHLTRCVESVLKNRQRFGRKYRILVSDDSDDPAMRTVILGALRTLAREFDAPIYYAGYEERIRFTGALARASGISQALLTFAFRSSSSGNLPTFGANLNTVLAATWGEILLCCDDDIVWVGAPAPGATDDLVLGSRPDPTVIRYYPDRSGVEHALEWTDVDIAAVHEKALGRPLADIVGDHETCQVRCQGISQRLCQAVSRNSGRATVSSLGIAGDCGMWSPRNWLFETGESQRQLFANGSYEYASTTRQVVRAATATSLTDGLFFQNAASGLDNRSLCSPFLPVCRNMDGVFARVMHVCAQDAYFVHFPWVVLHDPPERSQFAPGASREHAARVRVSDILFSWIDSAPLAFGVGTESSRLRSLGKHLTSLTELGSDLFDDYVRWSVLRLQHLRVGRLAARWTAVAEGAPEVWKEDLCRQLEELSGALRSGGDRTPAELRDVKALSGAEDTSFRKIVSQFGELLSEWPDMMQCVAELKEYDEGPARPITELTN